MTNIYGVVFQGKWWSTVYSVVGKWGLQNVWRLFRKQIWEEQWHGCDDMVEFLCLNSDLHFDSCADAEAPGCAKFTAFSVNELLPPTLLLENFQIGVYFFVVFNLKTCMHLGFRGIVWQCN